MTDISIPESIRAPNRPGDSEIARKNPRNPTQDAYTHLRSPHPHGLGDVTRQLLHSPARRKKTRINIPRGFCDGSFLTGTGSQLINIVTGEGDAELADTAFSRPDSKSLLPTPSKPQHYHGTLGRDKLRHIQRASKEEVSGRPYSLHAPKVAPQSANRVALDFYPWRGDRAEDALTEHAVKSGYYDKPSVSQNESSSARPLIWSSVKHKSGLQILSSLYISSLDRRQAHSVVTSKSTFKPPPRVTLTDAKREAWLKDLADSQIPLRKLSRTIPHGIRGKSLLDHCLAKRIPTWRAVWLAKCVGANEIRAFKRKGATGVFSSGGETKWVRDWTTNVQQFAESLIDMCGSEDWGFKMTYGLQLISHIHSDQLIEADAFLDWIVHGFNCSDETHVPAWLLLVRMYWSDIPKTRRKGHELATALSEKLLKVRQRGLVSSTSFIEYELYRLLAAFLVAHPACFLLPLDWTKHKAVIAKSTSGSTSNPIPAFSRICARNDRIFRDKCIADEMSVGRMQRELLSSLDGTRKAFDPTGLSHSCLSLTSDTGTLVSIILKWSTLRFRPRIWRAYVAVRLLRRLARLAVDLDGPIISLLDDIDAMRQLDHTRLYVVISQLILSNHFSIGKYLQWLLAKGSISGHESKDSEYQIRLQLLDSIFLAKLPQNILNLRNLVLVKLSWQSKVEEDLSKIAEWTSSYSRFTAGLFSAVKALEKSGDELCGGAKAEIASKARSEFASHLSEHNDLKASQPTEISPQNLIAELLGESVASLEYLQEFPVLADILHMAVNHVESGGLVAVVGVLNYHFDTLKAIGAMEPIFEQVLDRLSSVTKRTLEERSLFLSLLTLARRLPRCRHTASLIQRELALCEPHLNVIACSPISDQMAETVQNADGTFVEEMELLLSTGSSMDSAVLCKMFLDVTKRLEAVIVGNTTSSVNHYDMLARLRPFDEEVFDGLLTEWLFDKIATENMSFIRKVILPLVSSGSITLKAILLTLTSLLNHPGTTLTETAIYLCDMILNGPPRAHEHCIAGKIAAEIALLLEQPRLFLPLAQRIIALSAGPRCHPKACNIVECSTFPELLQDLAVDAQAEGYGLGQIVSALSSSKAATQSLDRALGLLTKGIPVASELGTLLHLANDYNIHLCQIRILVWMHSANHGQSNTHGGDSLISIMVKEAALSFQQRPNIWRRLLSSLPADQANDFHSAAVDYLFRALLKLRLNSGECTGSITAAENLLDAISATESLVSIEVVSWVIDETVSRLMTFEANKHTLPTQSEDMPSKQASSEWPGAQSGSYHLWMLLRILMLHHRLITQQKCTQMTLCRIAISFGQLLLKRRTQPPIFQSSLIFDILTLVSDSMSLESRLYCDHVFREHHVDDHRLNFLFSRFHGDHGNLLSFAIPENSKLQRRPDSATVISNRIVVYPLRLWEMVQDATPLVGENDTSLSLSLFDARKVV